MADQDNDQLWCRVFERLCAKQAPGLPPLSTAMLMLTHLVSIEGRTVHLAASSESTTLHLKSRLHADIVEAFAQEMGIGAPEVIISTDESLAGTVSPLQLFVGGQDVPSSPAQTTPVHAEPPHYATPTPQPVREIDLTAHEVPVPSRRRQRQPVQAEALPGMEPPPPPPPDSSAPRKEVQPGGQHNLNDRYRFESYVTGDGNRLASSAARAVAENPADAYNPLFIYGDSGLGKTHLLHAIGLYARELRPDARVLYVSAESFTNDFIKSIKHNTAEKAAEGSFAFHERYRHVDFLLIDDIQFMSGKEQTQEAFFHTFNALHGCNKQVVITSDKAPRHLAGFEDRMTSRFEWGLLSDVQPPSLETRVAILRMKAASQNITLRDDVLMFVAERVQTNIRELEGSLTRIAAFSNLYNRPLDVEAAADVLQGILRSSKEKQITIETIMAVTCEFYGVSLEELKGSSRSRKLVDARQVAMYLTRELTDMSLPKIGAGFGNRDHSTVMHSVRKITKRITDEQSIFDEVQELTARIRQTGRS